MEYDYYDFDCARDEYLAEARGEYIDRTPFTPDVELEDTDGDPYRSLPLDRLTFDCELSRETVSALLDYDERGTIPKDPKLVATAKELYEHDPEFWPRARWLRARGRGSDQHDQDIEELTHRARSALVRRGHRIRRPGTRTRPLPHSTPRRARPAGRRRRVVRRRTRSGAGARDPDEPPPDLGPPHSKGAGSCSRRSRREDAQGPRPLAVATGMRPG